MSDPTREVRYCAVAPIELREDTDKPLAVTGYAAVFGERTAIGPLDKWGWEEVVEAGAFSAALDRRDDVTFLIDHEGLPLARTSSGTLMLSQDQRGLRVETELDRAGSGCAADPAQDAARRSLQDELCLHCRERDLG